MGFLKKFQDTEKEATVKAFEADGLQMLPMEREKKHIDEKSKRV